MPTFAFLLHTTGILLDGEDAGDAPAIGFYSWRRARGKTSREAYDAVMAAMDRDPKLKDIIRSAHAAGLRPKTVVDQSYRLPWWKALLPWREQALMLYAKDDEE